MRTSPRISKLIVRKPHGRRRREGDRVSDIPVLRELDADGVLLLTLNRPERNNAWNLDMEEAFFDALVEGAADPDVRVIVITGAGRSFCPGLDIDALAAATAGERFGSRPRRPMTMARLVPKPVIAAINGACAGIGLIQSLCADLRFAAEGAKFTTSFARRGLPAENATAWMLPRLVGTGVAMDLLLSARVVLADEAKAIGLVDRLCAPDDLLPDALAYARDLARNCSPASMASIKRQVHADFERSFEESRRDALRAVGAMNTHPDFREGVLSFQEKRAPHFQGLSADIDVDKEMLL
jgi:enoyl-CoA hydratase/carnithine racemase